MGGLAGASEVSTQAGLLGTDEGEEAAAAFVAAKGAEAEQESFQPLAVRTHGVGGAAAGTFFCEVHRVLLRCIRKEKLAEATAVGPEPAREVLKGAGVGSV